LGLCFLSHFGELRLSHGELSGVGLNKYESTRRGKRKIGSTANYRRPRHSSRCRLMLIPKSEKKLAGGDG
jgi:hypothetical protein